MFVASARDSVSSAESRPLISADAVLLAKSNTSAAASLRKRIDYFAGVVGAGFGAAGGGSGVVPGFVDGLVSAGFSGCTSETLHSIAGRFSIGVAAPPFSKPLHSTLEILPSTVVNDALPRAVNVNLVRYSNTP